MNTFMADGAAQRQVAEMGLILFGQPGLTLMELAEKVKGMAQSDGQSTALQAAVSAIYFDDCSGYLSALRTVVGALDPALGKLLERDPAAAYEASTSRQSIIAANQPSQREPVAVVGHDLTLHWTGTGSIAPLVKRHGIGPGSKLYAIPPVQAVDLRTTVVPNTPEVRDILGRPNFWCSPWANVLRMRGDAIPRKAEEEQAAVIRFMLNHYLANGAEWAETAGAELNAIRKADSQAVGNG